VTSCTRQVLTLPGLQRRKLEITFDGGDVTSDAGVLLLRQVDRRLRLTERVAGLLEDSRRSRSCDHSLRDLVRQRVYAIAQGYEDLNDHADLRRDLAMQTAIDRDTLLAHPSTLCRLENKQDRASMWAAHEVMLDVFIESFDEAPTELVLDFDATDDAVHGKQEGRAFHGYYDKRIDGMRRRSASRHDVAANCASNTGSRPSQETDHDRECRFDRRDGHR